MNRLQILNKKTIAEFEIIYCDSFEEYKRLIKLGLKNKQIIKTSSPKLLDLKKDNIEEYKIDINSKIKNINWEDDQYYINLYKKLKNETNYNHSFIFTICRELYLYFRVINCFFQFNEKNLKKKTLFIKLNNYHKILNSINFNWEKYLINNHNFYIYNSNLNYKYVDSKIKTKNNFYLRLRNATINSIFTRLILICSDYLSDNLFKKNIYYYRENNTFLDAVPSLFIKGYKFIKIKTAKSKHNPKSFKLNDYTKKLIKNSISYKLDNSLNVKIEEMLKKDFVDHIEIYIGKIKEQYNFFINNLKLNKNKMNYLFSSYSLNIFGIALYMYSIKNNLKFVTFQHGIGNEILRKGEARRMVEKAAISKVHFVYSKKSKEYYSKSEFINCNIEISGMSGKTLKLKNRKIYNHFNKKILFVSTRLNSGYISNFPWLMSDYSNYLIEKNLIKNIFSKVKSNIYYKSYPEQTLRYVDEDPINLVIKKSTNIKYLDSSIDVRYIYNIYNIFITNRFSATSTWLMLTNTPLIFINHHDTESVRYELKEKLEKSFFYFEYEDINLKKKLGDLLNKPLKDILKKWKNKENDRNKFIFDYINTDNKKVYNNIVKNIN